MCCSAMCEALSAYHFSVSCAERTVLFMSDCQAFTWSRNLCGDQIASPEVAVSQKSNHQFVGVLNAPPPCPSACCSSQRAVSFKPKCQRPAGTAQVAERHTRTTRMRRYACARTTNHGAPCESNLWQLLVHAGNQCIEQFLLLVA